MEEMLIKELARYSRSFNTAPRLEQMPRRTLADKGIAGPTAAHVIEELHCPHNLASIAVTTGTTAFQNIVGVTWEELPDRAAASRRALEGAGVRAGDRMLVCYPPLVSVFSRSALDEYGVQWFFLESSSRDSLLLALIEERPSVVIGESSFLRAALEDARKTGIAGELPQGLTFIAAGTPLDRDLPETAGRLVNGTVHDLYGCQEFGWLTLDGVPLRDDISLCECAPGLADLAVGGLPLGDRFPITPEGHVCNPQGKIITYGRLRTQPEMEVTVLETAAVSAETVERLSRTVLRIKARIVRPSGELKTGAAATVLSLAPFQGEGRPFVIRGPEKTGLFDCLLEAQRNYQRRTKTDPAWVKSR